VSEQKGTDALCVAGPSEGDAAPKGTKHLRTKAVLERLQIQTQGACLLLKPSRLNHRVTFKEMFWGTS